MFGNKASLLLDTDIFINYLRGQKDESDFIYRLLVKDEYDGYYSSITEVELLAAFKISEAQANKINALLNTIYRVEVNSAVARHAGRLLANFRKTNGLEMPDAIIAASALACGATLVTKNAKHYSFIPGLVISLPMSYSSRS
jgi:predicted nucleic acid-binding protein